MGVPGRGGVKHHAPAQEVKRGEQGPDGVHYKLPRYYSTSETQRVGTFRLNLGQSSTTPDDSDAPDRHRVEARCGGAALRFCETDSGEKNA